MVSRSIYRALASAVCGVKCCIVAFEIKNPKSALHNPQSEIRNPHAETSLGLLSPPYRPETAPGVLAGIPGEITVLAWGFHQIPRENEQH